MLSLNKYSQVISLSIAEDMGAVAAFSTRRGGVSPEPYGSLNMALKAGDPTSNVDRNLELFLRRISVSRDALVYAKQVHGTDVWTGSVVPSEPVVADILISSTPGLFVGVKTADCVPILLLDPVRKIAAAVHAGWRGTVHRVIRKALTTMQDLFGCRAEDLVACIGPAIGACCYEVDDTVVIPFREQFPDPEHFILEIGRTSPVFRQPFNPAFLEHAPKLLVATESASGSAGAEARSRDVSPKAVLDLVGANRQELKALGLRRECVFQSGLCTSCNEDLFFSHRRDRGTTGRHLAVAGFRR